MLYILALVLFFGVHLIPLNKSFRQNLIEKLGEKLYRLVFALISLGSVMLAVWSWNNFPNVYFYEPPVFIKQINLAIMLPVVYLWIAAEVPNNVRRMVKNPMLMGMTLWALGHLLANGDLRSMILFISFFIYSLLSIIISEHKESEKDSFKPIGYDLAVVAVSIIGYGVLVHFHGDLFGMPVEQYFAGL